LECHWTAKLQPWIEFEKSRQSTHWILEFTANGLCNATVSVRMIINVIDILPHIKLGKHIILFGHPRSRRTE
jgi:hypothetical protein